MLEHLWFALRVVLSVAAVACGTWLAFDFASYGAYNVAVGAFSVMLAIAATPWVLIGAPARADRPASLMTILAGIGSAIMAASYVATPYVMENCAGRPSPRSQTACEFFNLLYRLGGNWAIVASFALVAAAFIFGGGYILLRLTRRNSAPRTPSSAAR